MEAYEESGEFPPDVEFVELETDVGWYGRHARKILRDQVSSFLVPQKVLGYHYCPGRNYWCWLISHKKCEKWFCELCPILIQYLFIQITLRGEIQMTLIPKCFVMCSLLVDQQSHEYPFYPIMLRISMKSLSGCDKAIFTN